MSIQLQFLPSSPASSSRTTAMLRFQGAPASPAAAAAAASRPATATVFLGVGRGLSAANNAINIGGGGGGGRGRLQIVGRDVCLGQARAQMVQVQGQGHVQRSSLSQSLSHQIVNLGDFGSDDYYNIDAAREAEASLESQFLPDNGLYDFETLSSPGFSSTASCSDGGDDDGDGGHLLHPATPLTPASASVPSPPLYYNEPTSSGSFESLTSALTSSTIDHEVNPFFKAREAGQSPAAATAAAEFSPVYDDDEHMYDLSLIATPAGSVSSVESVDKAAVEELLTDVEEARFLQQGHHADEGLPDLSSDEIASFLKLLKSQPSEEEKEVEIEEAAVQTEVGGNDLNIAAAGATAADVDAALALIEEAQFESIPVLAEEDFVASAEFSEMKPLGVQFSPSSNLSPGDALSMAIAAADLGDIEDVVNQSPVEAASILPAAVGTIDIRTWFDLKEAQDAQDPVYNSVQILVSSPSPAPGSAYSASEEGVFTPAAAAGSDDAAFSASGYSTDDYSSSPSSSSSSSSYTASSIMSPAGFSSCSGASPAPASSLGSTLTSFSAQSAAPKTAPKSKSSSSSSRKKATGAKRGRKPSLIPRGSDPVKKEKKKQQNKDAAKRYREKKRVQEAENLIIVKELQKRNKDLKKEFRALFAKFEGAKFLAEAAYGS